MYSAKDREEKKINCHKPHRSKISTQRQSCCIFGGTAKELCIMSCFRNRCRVIKTTLDLTSFWQHDKNYCSLAGMSCLIRLIRLILHHQIFIYLYLCKILLLEKISLLWKIAKSTLKSFSSIKLGSSRRMEFSNCLKGGAKLLKKRWIYYWIKLFFNMKILSFNFT